MRKEEYIQEIISRIENKKAKQEVEKELSAHIDDRISYYTDAGWDEETANEKAMEHMGEPEKVSEEMGKLHDENYSKAFIALIVSIAITAIASVIIILTGYFDISWEWYDEDTYFYLCMFAVAFGLNLLVFLMARKAHKKDSFLYLVLLAIQISRIVLLLIAPGVDYYYYNGYEFVLIALNAVTLALVIVCCHWRDKESKGISTHFVVAVSSVFISLFIDVLLILLFAYMPMGIRSIAKTVIDRKIVGKYFENMPAEKATEEEQKQYDISKYSDSVTISTDKGDFDKWYINCDEVKPIKMLFVQSDDDSYGYSYVYWISDCDGILIRSRPLEVDGGAMVEYLISEDYNFPDSDTDEIKSLDVYGVDITSEFDADYLRNTLSAVRYWDNLNIVEVDAVKTYKLSWTFKNKDCVFLYKAFLLEDKDGNFCFAPTARKKPNEQKYESFGKTVPVDEATSAQLHEMLKDVPSMEEWYSYPESYDLYFYDDVLTSD